MCTSCIQTGQLIIMKFKHFLRESNTCPNYQSQLWLVRFGPARSDLSTHREADNSKWSRMCCTVFSHEQHPRLKPNCLCSFQALCPSLTDTVFACWPRQLFTLKICSLCRRFVHFVAGLQCVSWQNVWKAQLSLSLSLSLSSLQNRSDNDTPIGTPDKRTETKASQSSIMAETMTPSTSVLLLPLLFSSSAGVQQSAVSNKKSKRDKLPLQRRNDCFWLLDADSTMYCQVCLWLHWLSVSGSLQDSLLITIWPLPVVFWGCVYYFKGYWLLKFLALSVQLPKLKYGRTW